MSRTAKSLVRHPLGITQAELARRFCVSATTVRGWREMEGFPMPLRVGNGALRFDWDRVLAWVNSHREEQGV